MKQLITILLTSYSLFLCLIRDKEQNQTTRPGYKNVSPGKMIEEGQSLLKEGDLIVRLNRDPSSLFIKNFNRHDKRYSHSGIVLFENGYPYVFHMINGQENPDGRLRLDSLKQFCNPVHNKSYGIFRYNMNETELKKIKNIIHKYYAEGVCFDNTFNLASNDQMYCSEMISKALKESTDNRISIEPTKLTTAEATIFSAYAHLPFSYTSHLEIVSIDDLYVNPLCRLVKEYHYAN